MGIIRPTVTFLLLFTLLLGSGYPLLCTAAIQLLFPAQAGGSLIHKGGVVVGSALIGQHFTSPRHFWGRLSATAPYPYNAGASTGSNYGVAHPALLEAAKARHHALGGRAVPVELATASGSGLDPHISPEAAEFQIARVAAARNMNKETLRELVARHTEGRQLGLLGEPRVNVLLLNRALDGEH